MGSKRLESLSDYHRHGYRVRIDCMACRRVVILAPLPLLETCRKRGWKPSREVLERRLRCGDCGARKARLGPAFGS